MDLVELAAQRIVDGELVAFPTETVYGLGARADNDAAVQRIYALKGRPSDHPLIVHVLGMEQAAHFADPLDVVAQSLMRSLWPGPLTLIVPRRAGVATAAAGGHPTIGLRSPSHPMARHLLEAALKQGVHGVAAPSANRFGRISPTTAAHVRAEFGEAVHVLDGGACDVGIESTIVDVTREPPRILRPGVLTSAAIALASGVQVMAMDEAARAGGVHGVGGENGTVQTVQTAPAASGTLEAHYAPDNARVRVMPTPMLRQALEIMGEEGLPTLAVYSRSVRPRSSAVVHRRMPDQARAAAHELFAVLRELDAAGATLIWVEAPPDEAAWMGVSDRLRRAAATR